MTVDSDAHALRAVLEVALAVPRVVDEVLAGAPYASREELIGAHRAAATPLSAEEIDQALAHHPRIGDRPTGADASSAFSRREQAAADASEPELAAAITAGNVAYEDRFGRVFLIRAAGRSRAEILAELTRRLDNDPAAELDEVAEQLRQIAALRLEQSLDEAGTPVKDDA